MVVPSVGLLLNYVKSRGEWRQEWQSSFEDKSRVVFCISHVPLNSSFSTRELRWCTSSVIFCFDEAFMKFTEKIIAHIGGSLRRTAVFWEVTACTLSDCTASQPARTIFCRNETLGTYFRKPWSETRVSSRYSMTKRREGGVVSDNFLSFILSFFLWS